MIKLSALKSQVAMTSFLILVVVGIVISFFFDSAGKGHEAGVDWTTLEQVRFTPKWDEAYGTKVKVPVFPDTVSRLDGRRVEITGYYIPMELNSAMCALSKNPNRSCFFCGKATIGTVMIINFRHKMPNFAADDLVTVRGRLNVVHSVNDFVYKLADADLVRINK